MNQFSEKMANIIQNFNDITDETLFLRLYEEYNKNLLANEYSKNDISLIEIKIAHKNINNKIAVLSNKIDEPYYYNEKMIEKINFNHIILEDYMANFNINDKKKIEKTLDLITKLEALLKLNISFPDNIENCLENLIEKNLKKEDCEKVKRMG